MAFWNSEKIRARATQEELITEYDGTRVKHCSYELSLGPEVFVTDSPTGRKHVLAAGEQVVIPPGQFALLLTEETITIPNDAIGFISIKAGIKFRGLVNVSGFHVDPGFRGRLKFSVYNAGSQNIVLTRGQPVFLIWFNEVEPTMDRYTGVHSDQQEISAEDVMRMQGEVSSPAALRQDIDALRIEVNRVLEIQNRRRAFFSAIWAGTLGAIFGGLFVLLVQWASSPNSSAESSPKPLGERPAPETSAPKRTSTDIK
jgi:dCTP deaminase